MEGERGRDGFNKAASEWKKKRLFLGYIENNCFERMRPINWKVLTDKALLWPCSDTLTYQNLLLQAAYISAVPSHHIIRIYHADTYEIIWLHLFDLFQIKTIIPSFLNTLNFANYLIHKIKGFHEYVINSLIIHISFISVP